MIKVTPLIMVSIDWPYGTEFCGIYSSEDLADEFIDSQVGTKYSEYGSYTKAMFSKTTVYLDDIVPEPEKVERCKNQFITTDSKLTFVCELRKGHEGYHTMLGALWGFGIPGEAK